jgi:hypothetical protein
MGGKGTKGRPRTATVKSMVPTEVLEFAEPGGGERLRNVWILGGQLLARRDQRLLTSPHVRVVTAIEPSTPCASKPGSAASSVS